MTPKTKRGTCRCCGGVVVLVDGAWVRDARMARGIKLAHVASRLGVSSSYVSQLEAGLRPFSLKLWTRYRKALEG